MERGVLGQLFAILLVSLTAPDGARIDINATQVTSVREPRGVKEGHFAPETRCLVVMSNGKFIAVRETCEDVRGALRGTSLPHRAPCIWVCGEAPKR
jgi:hypothetical protein